MPVLLFAAAARWRCRALLAALAGCSSCLLRRCECSINAPARRTREPAASSADLQGGFVEMVVSHYRLLYVAEASFSAKRRAKQVKKQLALPTGAKLRAAFCSGCCSGAATGSLELITIRRCLASEALLKISASFVRKKLRNLGTLPGAPPAAQRWPKLQRMNSSPTSNA